MKALWTVGLAAAIVSLVGNGSHARQLEPAGRTAVPEEGALRQQPSGSPILLAKDEDEDEDKDKTPKPTKTPEPAKTPKPTKTPEPTKTPKPTKTPDVSPHS